MKMKRLIAVFLAVCLLLGLTACAGEAEAEPTILDLNGGGSDSTSSGADGTSDGARTGVTIEDSDDLKSGTLLYTVTGARAVNRAEDIPTDGGFDEYGDVWQIIDGEEVGYLYPEMFLEDGSLLENCYLILVDITVESRDAVAKTYSDYGYEKPVQGLYEDPYVFRCDWLTLVDPTEKISEGQYYYQTMDYFSRMNEREEHNFTFRLEPGETTSFTIGYLIGGFKHDGSLTDLSQLCLCNTSGDIQTSTLIRLGLGG